MKYYVVICLYRTGETSNDCEIVGIKYTYEDAKQLFDETLPDVISNAKEWGMEYDEEEVHDNYFEAYGNEWHPSYYMKLYIQGVK